MGKKKTPLKSGNKAPASGQYVEIGPRGRKGREITATLDEPLPPTTRKRATYALVDPTDNKSGRGKQDRTR